jgi:hypothetical protein
MKPRSINIFLLDGDPNGIRVAQIMMSTIQAIAFRRNKLGEVRKTFPEIERPGVYILIGEDENEPDRELAYIGESEAIGDRLSTHNSNKNGRDSKDFWTDTIVLISKDENLTKSHARYVEACLMLVASKQQDALRERWQIAPARPRGNGRVCGSDQDTGRGTWLGSLPRDAWQAKRGNSNGANCSASTSFGGSAILLSRPRVFSRDETKFVRRLRCACRIESTREDNRHDPAWNARLENNSYGNRGPAGGW